ncbi:FKBP-type peptidyl-prolyl cis-trans isomerase [Saccharothrix sp. AJ9571]|nr:FKBP-type peptidyl-prolyl cis-trans isomerase [Saccharothrix sp. AJ9571]
MRNSAKLMVVVAAALTLGACANSEQASTQPPGSTQQPSIAPAGPNTGVPGPGSATAPPGQPTGPECTVDQIEVTGEVGQEPEIKLPDGCAAPTKLLTKDLEPGQGTVAAAGSAIEANYLLMTWSNKQVADNSYEKGEPLALTLGAQQVIPGWEQGLEGMYQGGRRLIVVPPDLAYGKQLGHPLQKETLAFVVDAVKVAPGTN